MIFFDELDDDPLDPLDPLDPPTNPPVKSDKKPIVYAFIVAQPINSVHTPPFHK